MARPVRACLRRLRRSCDNIKQFPCNNLEDRFSFLAE
ncbi:unnamed protein product [Brugia timori]|uniref:DUF3265 domain-containing protein n=2 Tax=Brugia TaxID=6278 RepID=A0A0R3QQG4_9BILA|nr:unnamed protein product [Brugia timori]